MLFELKKRGNLVFQAMLVTLAIGTAVFGNVVGALGLLELGLAVAASAVAIVVWVATSPAKGDVLFEDGAFIVRTNRLGLQTTSRILYAAVEDVVPVPAEGRVAITYRARDRRRTTIVWPACPQEFAGEVEWRRSVERAA